VITELAAESGNKEELIAKLLKHADRYWGDSPQKENAIGNLSDFLEQALVGLK